jgi:hypothetical protein
MSNQRYHLGMHAFSASRQLCRCNASCIVWLDMHSCVAKQTHAHLSDHRSRKLRPGKRLCAPVQDAGLVRGWHRTTCLLLTHGLHDCRKKARLRCLCPLGIVPSLELLCKAHGDEVCDLSTGTKCSACDLISPQAQFERAACPTDTYTGMQLATSRPCEGGDAVGRRHVVLSKCTRPCKMRLPHETCARKQLDFVRRARPPASDFVPLS